MKSQSRQSAVPTLFLTTLLLSILMSETLFYVSVSLLFLVLSGIGTANKLISSYLLQLFCVVENYLVFTQFSFPCFTGCFFPRVTFTKLLCFLIIDYHLKCRQLVYVPRNEASIMLREQKQFCLAGFTCIAHIS